VRRFTIGTRLSGSFGAVFLLLGAGAELIRMCATPRDAVGQFRSVERYDLKVDGVRYATCHPALDKFRSRLEQTRYRILSGAVRVPTS
jgi:hypothetical protein